MVTNYDQPFETVRNELGAYAYRMLGSRQDADDIVQESWIRWRNSDQKDIANPAAYLFRVAHNLCLDRFKSAQAKRETYVGSWLPEPLVNDFSRYSPAADDATELAQDLSFALMLTLERLSASERAAFLLHDVFSYSFDEVASILQKSAASCRQLASRARVHVKESGRRQRCDHNQAQRIAEAFARATQDGNITDLAAVLAEDVRMVSDGGGRVAAMPRPLHGREKVAKAWLGFAKLSRSRTDLDARPALINGLPGFVIESAGEITQTVALETDASGRVSGIYVMRNPEKLRSIPGRQP